MRDRDQILSLLSIARLGGGVERGGTGAAGALKRGRAGLVFLARDAAENTKKEICGAALPKGAAIISGYGRQELSGAVGRDDIVVAAVCNRSLAARIRELEEQKSSNGGDQL